MATRVTFPSSKKACHGFTPGKTYKVEMMAFVKVSVRSTCVEPAWRLLDDHGRMRWVLTALFESDDAEASLR